MKKHDSETHQLLVLLKLDAQRLYERIKLRAPEYLSVFSGRRIREHFAEVFKNRYDSASIEVLQKCSPEVIVSLDQFYTQVDNLRWYLDHTQDMPMMVSDKVYQTIRELRDHFETLNLYIDAELGVRPLPTEEPATDFIIDESPSLSFEDGDDEPFTLSDESD